MPTYAIRTLKYRIKEHARLLIFILPPLLALILPCLFINFWILPLLLVYSVFTKDTWNCKQELLLHGKVYISSQTVQSANSEPNCHLCIVLLFNTFPPARVLDFQKKKNPPCSCLFHTARLLNFRKISTLLNYSILLFYLIKLE